MDSKKTKEPKFTRICPECSKEFKTNRRTKIFCLQACQFKAWSKKHPRRKLIEEV